MKRSTPSTPSSDTSNELPVEQQNDIQAKPILIPSKKQKIGKHQNNGDDDDDDDDDDEYEPVDEGNGWTRIEEQRWLNQYTGEEIAVKPMFAASKDKFTSLDIINQVAMAPNDGQVVGLTPGVPQMISQMTVNHLLSPADVAKQQEEARKAIWHVNYNKSKQNLKEYAGHIVGHNRGNLLKTVVNSFAATYVWHYPALVDEILVRCQMMDENFIANYVKQLPDNINIKGNAEEPVDLLDSDEEVDHGAHDDGFVDGVVEADSSEEEDDYDNSPAHADHDASSQQSSNAGSQGEPLVLSDDNVDEEIEEEDEQHANLGSKKGSKEGEEEEEEVAVNV
jgi:hypothetical protein